MREGILVLGSNMRVSTYNDAAASAFGRAGEDLQDRRLSEIIRDFTLHEAFEKALTKQIASEVRVEMLGEGAQIFNVFVSPLDMGDENAAIGVFYDVSRVEKLERVRQEFLSNISHELRTPLTSILAFVETLADGAIDDRENNRRFLEVIRKNAERMHLLIDDFSELSLIEAGQIKVDSSALQLHDLVQDVLSSFSTVAKERKIELINLVPGTTMVTADPVRLQQMLTNLADNAIKFNSSEGTVTIAHEVIEGNDVISVADTGEGILEEHQSRIFERFYRIDQARSRKVGGTGLGLAIVKHLARLHNGEVNVKSTASVGATFCISLPGR